MLQVIKDDFDESSEDILNSINNMIKKSKEKEKENEEEKNGGK